MTTEVVHDQRMEKQMGCMAGFLQLFDRHHMITGKRIYATKRLVPSPDADSSSSSNSGKLVCSPASSTDLQQEHLQMHLKSSPESVKSPFSPEITSSSEVSTRMGCPLPVFDFKEGSRSPSKFREFPRLSLDSRAIVDGKGGLRPREIRATSAPFFTTNRCERISADLTAVDENDKQRRSPSVIARLMGLDALPDSEDEAYKKAELTRSASESRSRDLQLQYQYIEGKNLQSGSSISGNMAAKGGDSMADAHRFEVRGPTRIEFSFRKPTSEAAKIANEAFPTSSSPSLKSRQQRKSFFDSQDFYPEPKQNRSIYGEIEKRLKVRGIDEPAKDLETLKQILEALQLKGLLHSNKSVRQIGQRNFVFDRKYSSEESPIIVVQQSTRSPSSPTRPVRTGNNFLASNIKSKPGNYRNHLNLHGETTPPVRTRRDRVDGSTGRNSPTAERRIRNPIMSPERNENHAKSSNSLAKRNPKQLTIETQRRVNEEHRRSSPVHSPKITCTRRSNGPDHSPSTPTTSRSPRMNKRQTADSSSHQKERIRCPCPAEDELSLISESSCFSTCSQIDSEFRRSRTEEQLKEGKSLLERCDQLLHSIAEMAATESQPSPVSVLDSSFYKDESSPSPLMKRCMDFKDRSVESEEENWSPMISQLLQRRSKEDESDDPDFLYVSEVLQAIHRHSDDSKVFFLLEKEHQQHKIKSCDSSSYISRLHRKLIFDTITEILEKKKQLPPWKAVSITNPTSGRPFLREIWSELTRFRENEGGEDLFQVICGVLQRDMTGDSMDGWRECPMETSEVVLDVERSIFKDLIGETIRDLALVAGKSRATVPRRKLAF